MRTGLLHSEMSRREQELVEAALNQHNWNRRATADFLGISYRALFYLIEKHRLMTPDERQRILRNAEKFGITQPA
jgi:DNA-binding NtrC family response regulator